MSSKKLISIGLMMLLVLGCLSFASFTVEASENDEYYLILTATEGGSIEQPQDDNGDPIYREYEEGTSVVIEAEPEDHYEFKRWTGDTENIDNPESKSTNIEMNENSTVTAEFEKKTYELSVDIEGEGSVEVVPDEDDYKHGENVVIKAEADDNYVFEEWSGDTIDIKNTEDSSTIITMNDDYDITAEFEEDHYELSIDVDGEGQILQPDGEGDHEIEREENLVIEAKAEDHYEFKRWTGDTENIKRPESNITTVEMLADYDITAEFEKEKYELSIDSEDGGRVIEPGEGDFEYKYDDTVVLEADPDDMYRFDRWTGDIEPIDEEDQESELITITMKDDYDITAEFEEDFHELSIDSDVEGEIVRPGEGDFEFEKGEEIVIEAEAKENYEFDRWTGDTDGIEDKSSELTTITMEDDYNITAEFEKEKYELTVDIDGEGELIQPSDEGFTYEHGDEIVLEVEPDDGYEFTGWTGDTENIKESNSKLTTIILEDDYDITAEFESENIEFQIEWLLIALLAIAIIIMFIKNKRERSEEQDEEKGPNEGICENCEEIIPIDSKECPECGAPLAPPGLPDLEKAKT